MNRSWSWFLCRSAAHVAAAAWSRKAANRSTKKRLCGGPVRRFDIAVGRCRNCQRRVQRRHPLQTSDAVGVGNVQLGPEALTLAAILNKQMGQSLAHTRQVLSYGFGLEVSRGGLYRVLARMGDARSCVRLLSGAVILGIVPGAG